MTNKPLSQVKVLTESNIQLPRPSDPQLVSTFPISFCISLNPKPFLLCSRCLLDFQACTEENQMEMHLKASLDRENTRNNINSF